MAFIDRDTDGTGTLTFYNVSQAVGAGCPNWEEDVKVVQFFLQRIYSRPKYIQYKPWGDMAVDGKAGPITRAWITKFQLDMRRNGVSMSVDGIVDKAGNAESNYKSSISHTWYTIRGLNDMMFNNDTAVYKTLSTNPEVPPDVRLIFLQMQGEGPPMVFE